MSEWVNAILTSISDSPLNRMVFFYGFFVYFYLFFFCLFFVFFRHQMHNIRTVHRPVCRSSEQQTVRSTSWRKCVDNVQIYTQYVYLYYTRYVFFNGLIIGNANTRNLYLVDCLPKSTVVAVLSVRYTHTHIVYNDPIYYNIII